MGTAAAVTLAVVCAGCRGAQPPSPPEARLAAYLGHARQLEPLDRASFDRIVVEPFRSLYDDYAAQSHAPVIQPWPGLVRRQFAGDPALSPSQARLRWVLPVMYPAYVTSSIDTVFVEVDGQWRVLAGLDEALLARVRTLDPACAQRLGLAGPAGPCTDIGWVIADSALRGETARFSHACALAVTACME